MNDVTITDIKKLIVPSADSHKGQNGRMLLVGGSHLFHAASLWSLTIASRIVDLVHYASVPENNDIVQKAKEEFRNGIVVHRRDIEEYIKEDDVILIGPGMMRSDELKVSSRQYPVDRMTDIDEIEDEGVQTAVLTNYLLKKYPEKQWVIDAGALQMIDISLIPKHAILTPHHGEFEGLWKKYREENTSHNVGEMNNESSLEEKVKTVAERYQCIVLHKGPEDIGCDGSTGDLRRICGGNAGMTKGGTGDVLAGLIAALACTNDPFLATITGSFINKKAGDALYETVGPFFNASDLAGQIPKTMKEILLP